MTLHGAPEASQTLLVRFIGFIKLASLRSRHHLLFIAFTGIMGHGIRTRSYHGYVFPLICEDTECYRKNWKETTREHPGKTRNGPGKVGGEWRSSLWRRKVYKTVRMPEPNSKHNLLLDM